MLNFNANDFLKISPRIALAILLACSVLLYIPINWMPVDVSANILDFREKFGVWIFIFFAISMAILLSYLISWSWSKINKKIEAQKMWRACVSILKDLSPAEKEYLRKHYQKRQETIFINLMSPLDSSLRSKTVITVGTGTVMGQVDRIPGFIQPWVFKVLDKHPEILNMKKRGN